MRSLGYVEMVKNTSTLKYFHKIAKTAIPGTCVEDENHESTKVIEKIAKTQACGFNEKRENALIIPRNRKDCDT